MAVWEVLTLGHPLLRRRSKRISSVDEAVRRLARDMVETMHAYQGVGLAAPQIGVLLRIVVIQLREPGDPLHVLVNPLMLKRSGQRLVREGCLSVPGYKAKLRRSELVVVSAVDLDRRPLRLKARGRLAQALEHELDHLNGILYVDRLESIDHLQPLEPARTRATGEISLAAASGAAWPKAADSVDTKDNYRTAGRSPISVEINQGG